MSTSNCPTESELVAYSDADAPPEQLAVIRSHLGTCSACRARVDALEQLAQDIAAPLPEAEFDVQKHTEAILGRLESTEASPRRSSSLLPWVGVLSVAAALFVLVAPKLASSPAPNDEWTARGTTSAPSLGRDVGVRFYTLEAPAKRLTHGSQVSRRAAWTADLHNVGAEPAYALLFLVDSASVVHWVAPAYADANAPPNSLVVSGSEHARRLDTSVVFDDLALGKARLVQVLMPKSLSVLQIDTLPPAELELERLKERFPEAELRELEVEITP